jgi:hypothetical protein
MWEITKRFCKNGNGIKVLCNTVKLIKGLDKEIAQKNFIKEAEDMGIPPVKWEKSCGANDPLSKIWVWPLVDSTVGHSKTTRNLASRSDIPVPPTGPSNVLLDNVAGVIWSGLVLLSKIVSLWTAQPRAKGGSRRLHARAWAET